MKNTILSLICAGFTLFAAPYQSSASELVAESNSPSPFDKVMDCLRTYSDPTQRWRFWHGTKRQAKLRDNMTRLRAKYLQHWQSFQPPESLVGLDLDQSMQELQGLLEAFNQKTTENTSVNQNLVKVSKRAQILPPPSNTPVIAGLVKSPSLTRIPGKDTTFEIYTSPRSEVLMFMVDRLFGFQVMPPTQFASAQTTIQLMIEDSYLPSTRAEFFDPKLLPSRFALFTLDTIANNRDRNNGGNLRVRDDGHILAIDFDLISPQSRTRPQMDFPKTLGFKLDGKTLNVPLMVRSWTYLKIKSVSKESIRLAADQLNLQITDGEVNRIFAYAEGLRIYLDGLIEIYGEELILI